LRNVYVTIHGSKAVTYMEMLPPTLEEWTEQGPYARPIPINCIWSENYAGRNQEFLYASDSDSDDSDNENA
jgi:hypothetical protein